MNAAAQRRLSDYFDRIGALLGRKGRPASFALYAEGVFGDGERKSIEPIAARACADPSRADAEHQRLLHFALDAPWSDHDVRREAARYALEAMTAREPVDPGSSTTRALETGQALSRCSAAVHRVGRQNVSAARAPSSGVLTAVAA